MVVATAVVVAAAAVVVVIVVVVIAEKPLIIFGSSISGIRISIRNSKKKKKPLTLSVT